MGARYGRRSGGRAESVQGGCELSFPPRARAGHRSSRLLPWCAAVAVAALVVAPLPAAPQGPSTTDPDDPTAARAEVAEQRADLAAEIDVLSADEAEIRAAVASLDASVRAAEAQLADADRNVARAREEAALAERQAADAAQWLDVVRAAVARMAADAYIHPPSQTDLDVLESVDSATDEALKRTFLSDRTGKDTDLLDDLRQASADLELQQERATAAEAAAQASSAQLQAKVAQLEAAKAEQESLVVGIQTRLEARLAEADALSAIDAELAEQIRSQELALVASLALPPVTGSGTGGGPSTPTTTGSTATTTPGSTATTTPGSTGTTTPGSTGTTAPPPTKPPTTSPPTTAPPTTKPPTTTPPTTKPGPTPSIVSVRGIWVNQSIADSLERLLAAAEADGIILKGGGYRDPASQIALRKAHCGPTEYDIWQKPASQCTPPTAPPGKSMHEQGLAIDFTYNGKVITSRTSPAFVWLAANAASFGFYNLPSEPWHWSINGH